jgi:hypothetical protein
MSADELDDPSPRDWFSYPDALEFVVQHFGSVRRAFAKLHAGLVSEAVRSLRGLDQGDKFVPLPADAWREGGDIEVKLTTERRGSRQVLGETWREDDLEIIWREFELLDHDLVLLSREDVARLCGLPKRAAVEAMRKPTAATEKTDERHARKIPGKHKSPAEAVAEAEDMIAKVEAYQKNNTCTQEAALEALHRDLGHQSAGAAKTALHRARKLLQGK